MAPNVDAIAGATGVSWERWVSRLNDAGAQDLSHSQIVSLVRPLLAPTVVSPDWWAQSVTVAYEQHIGKRVPGQAADGSFQVSVTKTVPGELEEEFSRWCSFVESVPDIGGLTFAAPPTTSITTRWRYWRVTLDDATNVVISMMQKEPEKVGISINHSKLASRESIAQWRAIWKDFLEAW